jgi:hypothetical protein
MIRKVKYLNLDGGGAILDATMNPSIHMTSVI